MTSAAQVVVVGGGPAGATTAIFLADFGISVTLVEQASFPREHIGESLSGEVARLLRDVDLGETMDAAGFPIKRSTSVHGAKNANVWKVPVVEPIEGKPAYTWQVRRPEFDQILLDAATERGTTVVHGKASGVVKTAGRITGLQVSGQDGSERTLPADVIVDASGMSAFLSRMGISGPRERGAYDKQLAIYGQFENVKRDEAPNDGNTHLFYAKQHNWAWLIPISDTVTSIGLGVPSATFKETGLSVAEYLDDMVANLHPGLTERTRDARLTSPVWTSSNFSYEVSDFAGPGFICVGDAHQFTDPIFSFGVSNAMQEARFAATAIREYLALEGDAAANIMSSYIDTVNSGQHRARLFIDSFWQTPLAFLKLAHFDHPKDITEFFSGRIYGDAPGEMPAIQALTRLRALNEGTLMREAKSRL